MLIQIEISSALQITIPISGKNLIDEWDVCEGARVEEILEMLNLSQVQTLLTINGRVVNDESILKAGDTVKIFPLISGG